MPVKIWTGLPGAGKTAAMVAAILQFKREFPHRPVYAININGLHESVAEPLTLEQLHRWWELPPEALICIDECQEPDFMPTDQGKPAEWVKRISKVRHEGMDFWLCTQHPNLMSNYVRRLVDQHVHFVRKFNTGVAAKFTWPRCMENCEKESAQRAAITGFATLPKEVFDFYKSSNAHNMKRRVPWKAWVLPVAAVAVLCALVALPFVLKRLRDKSAAPTAAAAGTVKPAAAADVKSQDDLLRTRDFSKWMRPRVDGVPWSAPMFDKLDVQAQPRLYCIAVEDGRCSCNTEQGTHYEVGLKQCRAIVQNGLYNPFVGPLQDDQHRERQGDQSPAVQPQARPAVDAMPLDGVSTGAAYKDRATAIAYLPPDVAPRPAYEPHALR